MACVHRALLSFETVPSAALAFTGSPMNDNSQTAEDRRNTGTADPAEKDLQRRHAVNCGHDSGHDCLTKAPQSVAERGRTVSTSSSDIDADRETHRRGKHRKTKTDKQQKTVTENSSGADSKASCQDCATDLTDSDVEVCQSCFGLRRQELHNKDMSEYCPFPFSFLKKRSLPIWCIEPEYVNFHPQDRAHKDREKDKTQGKQPVDEKIHRNTDSLLSTTSNFTNYRGLLNLCLLLLVLSNARLCMENLIKYGVLINPLYIAQNCVENLNNWPNAKILLYQGIHPAVALVVQILLSKGRLPEWFGWGVTFISAVIQLVYPAWVVLSEHPNPVFSSFTLAVATILFLKLISYAHVNYWCRTHKTQTSKRRRQSSTGDQMGYASDGELSGSVAGDPSSPPGVPVVRYPDNLNLKDLAYFILAPTLCYELNFPRSARIRKRFFLKRLAEMIFLQMVIIGLVQQWIVPTIRNSLKPLSDMDVMKCFERLLKLAIPNHFIWLLFFYAFFHSMLNVLAELLKFGDRDFYQDWWNAETIANFWKSWNIPVHRWAMRHIYKPLRKRDYNQMSGSIIVFIVSAFFHEYLVSIPLRMFKAWAFTGMLMQIPLAYVTGRFFNGTSGNIIMWVSLIVGQPVAILAYVHDYYLTTVVSQTVNETLHSALHTEL